MIKQVILFIISSIVFILLVMTIYTTHNKILITESNKSTYLDEEITYIPKELSKLVGSKPLSENRTSYIFQNENETYSFSQTELILKPGQLFLLQENNLEEEITYEVLTYDLRAQKEEAEKEDYPGSVSVQQVDKELYDFLKEEYPVGEINKYSNNYLINYQGKNMEFTQKEYVGIGTGKEEK